MNKDIKAEYRVLRIKAVCVKTGLGRSTIYLKMSQSQFPNPIKIGVRAIGWLESDVDAWIESRR